MDALVSTPEFTVIIGAKAQVSDFVAFFIGECHEYGCLGQRLPATQVWRAYMSWARGCSVQPIPELTFFTQLGKSPYVSKHRDRLKDPATGRVVKLPSGSPQRISTFAFEGKPRVTVVVERKTPPMEPFRAKARAAARTQRKAA